MSGSNNEDNEKNINKNNDWRLTYATKKAKKPKFDIEVKKVNTNESADEK